MTSLEQLEELTKKLDILELDFYQMIMFAEELMGYTEDWHLRKLNLAWEKNFGWTIKELESKPFLEFVHPDDVEATRNVYERMKSGKTVTGFRNRYRTKRGKYKAIEWRASAFNVGGKAYFSGRVVEDCDGCNSPCKIPSESPDDS